jgi:hypothetical protein
LATRIWFFGPAGNSGKCAREFLEVDPVFHWPSPLRIVTISFQQSSMKNFP